MRRLTLTVLLLAGCTSPELDSWRKGVALEPNEAHAGMQAGLCRNPPPDASAADLKRCKEVVLPAIVALAKDRIEHPSRGMDRVVACPLLLRALPEDSPERAAAKARCDRQ